MYVRKQQIYVATSAVQLTWRLYPDEILELLLLFVVISPASFVHQTNERMCHSFGNTDFGAWCTVHLFT